MEEFAEFFNGFFPYGLLLAFSIFVLGGLGNSLNDDQGTGLMFGGLGAAVALIVIRMFVAL